MAVKSEDPDISELWQRAGFSPTAAQRKAILHTKGPLYLPAGPGSGKTRVLLWRTLHLIVHHHVHPDEIFLATFTEKAALQLREGIRALLAQVTAITGHPYDVARMYVGTVHSLCTRLSTDRRLNPLRDKVPMPAILDELDQYLWVARHRMWDGLLKAGGFGESAVQEINAFFGKIYYGQGSSSRYEAVTGCIQLFNRFSEEYIEPAAAIARTTDATLAKLLQMYGAYRRELEEHSPAAVTDLSLLQQHALELVEESSHAQRVFRYVIIDEYQDTNHVQERLFFALARESRNLCVVGDDDQALYRFRGATVENFVEFPQRCEELLGEAATTVPLTRNYRSRARIVEFYGKFIGQCNWKREPPELGAYRVQPKDIHPESGDNGQSVAQTSSAPADDAYAEIARCVKALVDSRRVENPNQIAFLFPSLKSVHVQRMIDALEQCELRVFAPRAKRFLEGAEATLVIGLFIAVFGRPKRGDFPGRDYADFHKWLDIAEGRGEEILGKDQWLSRFIADRKKELSIAASDQLVLLSVLKTNGWMREQPYDWITMKRKLYSAGRLSERARQAIGSRFLQELATARAVEGRPLTVGYVVNRATATDWSVLDLFYRLCGFEPLRSMFDAASREMDPDEGPLANLSLLSGYLGRFVERRAAVISGRLLQDDGFVRLFFSSYLFALFRRGESEYEDAEDPFPKGRIPFLTIHQAKGLEFPVVVLGNTSKRSQTPPKIEATVRPLVDRSREPLHRVNEFDAMRMFYVALSRPQNLLILARYSGPGISTFTPLRAILDDTVPELPDLDVSDVPDARPVGDDLPRTYSYTGDYLAFLRCPRQYMVFREYDFVPSRSQTMVFGTLVHRTMDDLHQWLIAKRSAAH